MSSADRRTIAINPTGRQRRPPTCLLDRLKRTAYEREWTKGQQPLQATVRAAATISVKDDKARRIADMSLLHTSTAV